jgi:lipid-A-disaccharide synthase
MTEVTRIFIVAGEASGDMQVAGLESLFPMHELSLMGFAEILPHAWRLSCLLKQTCDAAVAFRPDMVITIDSPGFTFRLVKWLRRCFGKEITCIHYVAPTVWAYKPERAATTAALFDHLLTLLPFEAPYFKAYGLKVTHTGHEIADGFIPQSTPPRPYRLGDSLHIALFAGSRRGEIHRLLPTFEAVVMRLRQQYRACTVSLVVTADTRAYAEQHVRTWRHKLEIAEGAAGRAAVLQTAHIALTKTGTVTLEIARAGVPMVATYRVHRATAWAVRKMLRIPFVNLINIMAGRRVIPELIQEECNASALYEALRQLIDSPDTSATQVLEAQYALLAMQNRDAIPASVVAADVILSYTGRK